MSVAFAHNSRRLASGSLDKTIKIWDVETGQCVQTLEGHNRRDVTSMAFSQDSRWLASASWDNTVKMWDTKTGRCVQTLEGHSGKVNSVPSPITFEPTGSYLFTDGRRITFDQSSAVRNTARASGNAPVFRDNVSIP